MGKWGKKIRGTCINTVNLTSDGPLNWDQQILTIVYWDLQILSKSYMRTNDLGLMGFGTIVMDLGQLEPLCCKRVFIKLEVYCM